MRSTEGLQHAGPHFHVNISGAESKSKSVSPKQSLEQLRQRERKKRREAKHIPAVERRLWSVERRTKLGTYPVSVDRPAPMSCWTTRRGASRERSEEKKLNRTSLEAEEAFCSAVGLWRDKRSEEDESPPCDRCLGSVMPRNVCYCRNPSLKHVPADWTSLPRSHFAWRSVTAHQLVAPAKVLPRYSSRAALRVATTEELLCVGGIKLDESLRVKLMIFTSRLLWSCLN